MTEVLYRGFYSDVRGTGMVYKGEEPFWVKFWPDAGVDKPIVLRWGSAGEGARRTAEALLCDAAGVNEPEELIVELFTSRFVRNWPWPGGWSIHASTIRRWLVLALAVVYAPGVVDDEGELRRIFGLAASWGVIHPSQERGGE